MIFLLSDVSGGGVETKKSEVRYARYREGMAIFRGRMGAYHGEKIRERLNAVEQGKGTDDTKIDICKKPVERGDYGRRVLYGTHGARCRVVFVVVVVVVESEQAQTRSRPVMPTTSAWKFEYVDDPPQHDDDATLATCSPPSSAMGASQSRSDDGSHVFHSETPIQVRLCSV